MLVKFEGFQKGSIYKGKQTISISRIDFLHSLLFVGQSRAYRSLSTLIYKFRILEPFLDFNSGDIIHNKTTEELEQTEKTFLSYNIGMAISDFCLRNLFDCKYTLHTSFGFYKAISFSGKTYKFDLIGITKKGDKIALEAKGSFSNSQSKTKAINQVKYATINGTIPFLKLVSLQGFSKVNQLYVNIIDPIDLSDSPTNIKINLEDSIMTVYHHLMNELQSGEIINVGNEQFYTKNYNGIQIGILKCIENQLSLDEIEKIVKKINSDKNSYYEYNNDKVFNSGLFIRFENLQPIEDKKLFPHIEF